MPKAAVKSKLHKICKAPLPNIHQAHNPAGTFLPKFPAAMFTTAWPPVLILILDGSLPSETEEETALVVAALPASAFMDLPSNSFFLYLIPSLFLAVLAGSVPLDTKLPKYLLIPHAVHGDPSHQTRGSSTDLFWITTSLLAPAEMIDRIHESHT